MAKNLTPAHLRCIDDGKCPSIHELEDGRLLIVGKVGHPMVAKQKLPIAIGPDETAVIVTRELLSNLNTASQTGEESKSGADVAEEAKS